MPDYAKVAYEAYAVHQDWKNYQGNPIPAWADVRQDIKEAWQAAVQAVLDAHFPGEMPGVVGGPRDGD